MEIELEVELGALRRSCGGPSVTGAVRRVKIFQKFQVSIWAGPSPMEHDPRSSSICFLCPKRTLHLRRKQMGIPPLASSQSWDMGNDFRQASCKF